MSKRVLYPESLNFRVSPDVRQVVARGAAAARCGESEYSRRVFLAGLEAMGVSLPPPDLERAA